MQPDKDIQPPVDETITPETPQTAPLLDQPAAEAPQPSQPTEPTVLQPSFPEPTQPSQSAEPVVVGTVAAPAATRTSFMRNKKFKLAAIIAAAVLLVGGGSAAAYYTVVLPNQPDRIAQKAIINTIDPNVVKSGYFEGDVSFEGGEISEIISGLTFSGGGNQSAMQLKLDVNTMLTKLSLDVKTDDGKTLYLKLSGLNGADKLLGAYAGDYGSPEQLAGFAALLTSINDKWFMIDQSLLNQVEGGSLNLTNSGITSEDAKKLGEIYKKHQFLSIDKQLSPEDIHGVASHHIQATINKNQMIAFLTELKSANIKSLPVDQSTIDQINKVDFSKYPLDVWIAKKQKLVTQLATTIEESGTKYKIRVALFDFNKDFKVEKPTDARSILELLGEAAPLAGGLMGGTTESEATDLPGFEL